MKYLDPLWSPVLYDATGCSESLQPSAKCLIAKFSHDILLIFTRCINSKR